MSEPIVTVGALVDHGYCTGCGQSFSQSLNDVQDEHPEYAEWDEVAARREQS